ncbi:phage tail protein [Phaeovulum sp. W22_SRMD_FR3]|uniref:phage tail protein n=1 Tax=Phaeovulum sp. W22_SRMD_FR3 TaxID=3240274 RepID=UPI003F97E532
MIFALVLLALITGADAAYAGPLQVFAALIANGVSFGSAFLAVGGGALLGRAVISIGTSLLSSALRKKPEVRSGTELDVQMGDDQPMSFVLGAGVTAGRRKYAGAWGEANTFFVDVIEISSLPIAGLRGVWVNDQKVTLSASGPGEPGDFYAVEFEFGATRTVYFELVDGTQTAASPYLLDKFGAHADRPFTPEMIGRGCAYVIMTVRYDRDHMNTLPSVLFEPEPLALYDLRQDSTNGGSGPQRWDAPETWAPSENPAVMAYNVIRGIFYGDEWLFGGQNLPASRLPASSWIAAANECDAPAELAGGGTEPSYRAAMEVTVDMEPLSVIEALGQAANMRVAEVGGLFKALVGAPGSAVYAFTDEDIRVTEGQSLTPFPALNDTYNTLTATYPEPGEKWASKDAPEYQDAAAMAADGGRYLPANVSYPAVPFAAQVQRLMRAQMQDYRRFASHQFHLPPDAYALEPNDVVAWSSVRNGYNNKKFLVVQVSKQRGFGVLVSLREIDPADYDWSGDYQVPTASGWTGADDYPVQVISGWTASPVTLADDQGRARVPGIQVGCNPLAAGVSHIRVQVRVKGTAAAVLDTARLPYEAPFVWILQGGFSPATQYEVRGRYVSALTPLQEWSAWLTVTTPDIRLTAADLAAEVTDALAGAAGAAADALERINAADAAIALLDAGLGDVQAEQAETSALVVSTAGQAGVIGDQYLDLTANWTRVTGQGVLTKVANQIYPLGQSWGFAVTAAQADGLSTRSTRALWTGQANAAAYVAEVDFTLDSGSLSGAGFAVVWNNTGGTGYAHSIALSAAINAPLVLGRLMTARAVFMRPAGFAGTFDYNQLLLYANGAAAAFGGMAAKGITFHAARLRLATAEELGSGQVSAVIDARISEERVVRVAAEGALASSVATTQASLNGVSATVAIQQSVLASLNGTVARLNLVSIAGTGYIAGIEAVAWDGTGAASGSLLRLIGDDVVAEGTLSTNKLVVGLGRNFIENADFADGTEGWVTATTGFAGALPSFGLRAAGQTYAGATYPTYGITQATAETGGFALLRYRPTSPSGVLSNGMPVAPGDWVEASVRASTLRCAGDVRIQWLDNAGAFIASSALGAIAENLPGSSTNPATWARSWIKAQAPAGATFALLQVTKYATSSGTNSYLFLHEPQLCLTHAAATQPTPFSPRGTTLISGGRLVTNSVTAQAVNTSSFSAAGLAVFGGDLKSANFATGASGWRIAADGNMELNNLVVRGSIVDGAASDNATLYIPGSITYPFENYATGGEYVPSALYLGSIDPTQLYQFAIYTEYRFPVSGGGGQPSDSIAVVHQIRSMPVGGSWGAWGTIQNLTRFYNQGTGWVSASNVFDVSGYYDNVQVRTVLQGFGTTFDYTGTTFCRRLCIAGRALRR